jgi:hypothetical protein
MNQAHPGIAYLTEKIPVPVIPVGIEGTTDDFWQRASHGERPGLPCTSVRHSICRLSIRPGKTVKLPVSRTPIW